MKKYLIILLLFPLVTLASESWYRVTTVKGMKTYDFYGTVNYEPDEFIRAIQNNSFIKINNLVYFDNQNRVKSWSEWRRI